MLQTVLDNPINLVVIGIVAMLVLAIGIVFFVVLYQRRMLGHQLELKLFNEQKQRELLQASIDSEEEERLRISSELHDDVGATLSSIRLFLHSASKTSDMQLLDQSRELLDQSIEKVRSISHKLQPSMLKHLGLTASLEALAQTVTKSGVLKVSHSFDKMPELEEKVALGVYRIVQELLNNIIKHSHATSIRLESKEEAENFCVILLHNGKGLTNETYNQLVYKKGAIGLKNIVNRVQAINALITFREVQENLFETIISVPLTDQIHL